MRVAYVTTYYNGDLDGRFGRFHDWVHTLRDMESPPFEFDVFAFTASNPDETLTSRPHACLGEAAELWGKKRNKLEFALNVPRVARDLHRREYDLVHVLTLDLIAFPVAAALSDRALVIGPDVQGYFPERAGDHWNAGGLQGLRHRVDYRLKDLLVRADPASTLVALSEYHERQLTNIVSTDRIERIAPGVDRRFSVGSSDSEETVFLYVGDFTEYKGYPLFLEALGRLPDDSEWRAIVAGRGDPRRSELVRLGIEDRVQVEGFVPRSDLPRYYREADFFVMPSVDENGPNTIVEALASGTPVLATDRLGINEYPPEGAAVFFDRTTDSLHNALVSAMQNKRSLTEAATAAAPEFSAERTVHSLHDVYRRHLGLE